MPLNFIYTEYVFGNTKINMVEAYDEMKIIGLKYL